MQQLYVWLQTPSGMKLINDHAQETTALDSLSIEWGTSSIASQPDPSVLSITLVDRTGAIAGKPVNLIGTRIIVQLSHEPTYEDLQPIRIGDVMETVGRLAETYQPQDPTSYDDASTIMIFSGQLGNEMSITKSDDGAYLIDTSATSDLAMLKRDQKQGSTSNEQRFNGFQWADANRYAEIYNRAYLANMPYPDPTIFDGTPHAPVGTSETPSLLDLIHSAAASTNEWLCYEHMTYTAARGLGYEVKPFGPAIAYNVTLHSTMAITTDYESKSTQPIPARIIQGEPKLTISQPYTQIVIKGYTAKVDDQKKLSFEDATVQISDTDLPDAARTTQKSLTLESDAVINNQAGNTWDRGVRNAETDASRAVWRNILTAIDTTPTPDIKVSSATCDPLTFPRLYRPEPSGPIIITGQELGFIGGTDYEVPLTTIGGTLSYAHHAGRPSLTASLHTTPVVRTAAASITLGALQLINKPLSLADFSIGLLAQVTKVEE